MPTIKIRRDKRYRWVTGEQAFNLYSTHGLPLIDMILFFYQHDALVDISGFYHEKQKHRLASKGDKLI